MAVHAINIHSSRLSRPRALVSAACSVQVTCTRFQDTDRMFVIARAVVLARGVEPECRGVRYHDTLCRSRSRNAAKTCSLYMVASLIRNCPTLQSAYATRALHVWLSRGGHFLLREVPLYLEKTNVYADCNQGGNEAILSYKVSLPTRSYLARTSTRHSGRAPSLGEA